MGYLLLLLFFLTWRECRKIRKALYLQFYENGKPPSNFSRLLDIAENVHNERVSERKKKKVQSNERTANDDNKK